MHVKTSMSDYVVSDDKKYMIYVGHYADNDMETKIGKTTNLYSRCCTYNTSKAFCDFKYKFIIEVYDKEHYDLLECLLLDYFKECAANKHLNYKKRNKNNEWIRKCVTIQDIETALKTISQTFRYKLYNDEEVTEVAKDISNKIDTYNKNKYHSKKNLSQRIEELKNKRNSVVEWNNRQYQTNIINKSIEELTKNGRYYIDLATGAGKTFIINHIMLKFMPEVIIFLSPRKKINKQNTCDKYLSIFKDKYEVFNISERNEDFDVFMERCKKEKKKKIIVGCPNNKNIYRIIKDNNLQNIFIWFDEAHHTIENWTSSDDTNHTFLLYNEENVKYRVFTSASPDYNIVNKNIKIFGKLHREISVKDLIAQKWLCPILPPLILGENIQDYNLLRWIIDGFIKYNRQFGFSFHSRDNNAFELFYKHHTMYKDGNTTIKPFLLINDKGLNDKNREILRNISLDYKFRDVKEYECSPLSIAYVVKQYDMGYDFSKLDYISITDKKISFKDIIQCLGRGTRSDKLGPNGTNSNKDLLIALPTYMEENDKNEYRNIIEVMRYLIYDLEMDIETMFTNALKSSNGMSDTVSENYEGERENTSKLLELLYNADILNRPSNMNQVIKLCVKHNISTEQEYHHLRDNNPAMRLKTTLYDYGGFFWQIVVDPNKIKYYSIKSECIKAKEKIIMEKKQELSEDAYDEFMEDVEESPWKELNKYDSKIPPYPDIDKYYPPN